MAQQLELKLKLAPEIDVNKLNVMLRVLKESLGALGQDIKMIDADKLQAELSQIDREIDKISQSNDKLRQSSTQTEASYEKLGNSFKQASTSARTELDLMKSSLAQMEASGNKGSKEFNDMKAKVKAAEAEVKKLDDAFEQVDKELANISKKEVSPKMNLGGMFQFNMITQAVDTVANSMNQLTEPFIEYEKGLADFSAITGISGDALDAFGLKARELAKSFGGSAVGQIDAFKGILSRLGPDIAKSPEALERMGKAVNTLSAASGMDATSSMDALTSSLLQFDVSLDDPVQAAAEMEKMMQTLAAGAKEGAAEIPQVAQAVVVAGVAAKGAKLSFEETNAALQVLASGGKYGAEAGTALRNVLGMLQKASGPAEAAMKKMGTSSKELGQILTTQGLEAAVKKLSTGMNNLGSDAEKNAALMEIFGTENAAAAGILMGKADAIGELKGKITGTQTAFDQANVNMNTTAASIERFKAKMEDALIATFDKIGSGVTAAIGSITQLAPVINSFAGIKQLVPDSLFENLTSAGPKVKDFAVKILGMLVPSFATVGASAATAGTTATAAGTATGAAWATALGPITLIIAAIALVVGAFYLLYTKVEGFKKIVDDFVSVLVYGFERGWEVTQRYVSVLVSLGSAIFTYLTAPFQIAWGIVSAVIESFFGMIDTTNSTKDAISGLDKIFNVVLLTLNYVLAGVDGFKKALDSVIGSMSGVITKILEGDIIGAVKELSSAGTKAGEAFNTGFKNSLQESSVEDFKNSIDRAFKDGVEIQAKINAVDSIPKLTKELDELSGKIKPLEVKISAGTATDDEKKQYDELNKRAQETASKLQQVAPQAVTGMKTWIDSAGNLQQRYEINAAKAKELAGANKQAFSAEITEKQKSYSQSLNNQLKTYNDQKSALDELKKKITSTTDKTEVKRLTKEFEDQKGRVEETGKAIKEGYEKGAKAGLLTKDATNKVEKAFGFAKGTSEQLKKAQEQNTKEAQNTADAASKIGEGYAQAKKDLQDSHNANLLDYNALEMKRKSVQGLTAEEKIRHAQLYKLLKNTSKQLTDIDKTEQESSKKFQTKYQDNSKSAIELANAEYQIFKEKAKIQLDEAETTAERLRLEQNREKTALDDLANHKRKLQSLEDEKKKMLEIFNITEKEDGTVEIGIKAKEIDKGKLKNTYATLINDINKEKNNGLELQSKISPKMDAKEINEKIRKLQIEQLEYQIEIGLEDPQKLVDELTTDYNTIVDELNQKNARKKELELRVGSLSHDEEIELKSLEGILLNLQEKELSARKTLNQKKKAIYQQGLSSLQESNKLEIEEIEARLNKEADLFKIIHGSIESISTKAAEKQKEARLKELEDLKNRSVITEEEMNLLKEKAEEEYQGKITRLQEMARGAELEFERQHSLNLLREKEARLKTELAMAEQNGDVAGAEKIRQQLGDIETAIKDKGDLLKNYSGELQNAVTDIFSNLFNADEDTIKEPFKKMLSIVVGAIKQLITATVIQIVLNDEVTTALGAFAPIAKAALMGLVSAGLNAVLNPLLTNILSFYTGGRVDSPTLAVIGDASIGRAGSNTEWVMYDDQIKFLMGLVINANNKALKEALNDFSRDIFSAIKDQIVNSGAITEKLNLDVTIEKDIKDNFKPIESSMLQIKTAMLEMQKYIGDGSITADLVMQMSDSWEKMQNIEKDLYQDKISEDDYYSRMQSIEVSLKSIPDTNTKVVVLGSNSTSNNSQINGAEIASIIKDAIVNSNNKLTDLFERFLSSIQSTFLKGVLVDKDELYSEMMRETNKRKFS